MSLCTFNIRAAIFLKSVSRTFCVKGAVGVVMMIFFVLNLFMLFSVSYGAFEVFETLFFLGATNSILFVLPLFCS